MRTTPSSCSACAWGAGHEGEDLRQAQVNLVPMAFEIRRDGSYLIEQQVVVPTKQVRCLCCVIA